MKTTSRRFIRGSRAGVLGLTCALAAAAGGTLLLGQSVVLQPGTIQGHVTLGDLPVHQLGIRATWMTQSATASADAADYSITVNVPSGTTPQYTVSPTIYTDGGRDMLAIYDGRYRVDVSANAVSQLDLNYEPAFIEGTVSATGGTISSASVGASASGWNAETRTVQGQPQTFRFAILPGATVSATARVIFTDGRAAEVPMTFSNVIAGETRIWDVVAVAPSNSITGLVTVDALRPPVRRTMSAEGPTYVTRTVQDNGTYSMTGLPSGTYDLSPQLFYDSNGTTYLYGPSGTGSGFPSVTLLGTAAVVDRHVPLATISGTLTLSGSRTLASARQATVRMDGERNTTTNNAQAQAAIEGPGGAFELVVTPGTWRFASYFYYNNYFVFPTPEGESTLEMKDIARAPIQVAQGENATVNLEYATGSVTVVFRTTSGTFSSPRLQANCGDPSVTASRVNSRGTQTNVTEAAVTFIGLKGRCTVNAYGRPNSMGETSFGQFAVDVIAGSDQTIDLGGAPTLSVLTPVANSTFSTPAADVTGKVTDDQGVTSLTVNGVAATLTSAGNTADPRQMAFTASITLVPGANVIKTIATDASGKTATDTRTVFLDAPLDTTAPVISAPADLTAEAASANGTVVSFTATATDETDGSVPVSCSPAAASTFALGTTTVTCTATDAAGNASDATFTVTVADTIAPVLAGVPAGQTIEATGAAGAVVTYATPTANDIVDGTVAVRCSPASGATFPLGTTAVTCTATDAARNAATSTFSVTVRDTTAPVLAPLPPIVLTATSATGAPATFVATAVDLVSGSVPVSCSRVSGSEFALGTTTVSCTATDGAGNTAAGAFTVTVAYGVCLEYDTDIVHKIGSTIPVKLQLCTASGQNLSSPSLVVHARQLVQVSTTATGEVEDAGYANPDDDFRYVGLDGTGGYLFNLQTKGLTQGTYNLIFTVNGAPALAAAPFKVR